jgi:plastocyanin
MICARLSRILVLLACAAMVAVLGSCITDSHPLGTSGTVSVVVDIATPLFAANTVGANGLPSGPRQEPNTTGITLSMVEDGQPAWGAYVDVTASPPEALTLTSDPTEGAPTCVPGDGGLRCTANTHGYARLVASSQSQWSGMANVLVSWGGNQPLSVPITVSPAGLPLDVSGFALLVGGLSGTATILATNNALVCSTDALPGSLGTAWRPGMIRNAQAYVTASPSPTIPGALANAPVTIQSESAEAALSLTEDCATRDPDLEVLLDATGQSPPFYLCFSDNGGTINFNLTSGTKTLNMQPQVIVQPEPRLLRVVNIANDIPVNTAPVNIFEVSAYNANLARIAIAVDLAVADDTVLQLNMASVTLADATGPTTVVSAIPLMTGMTTLTVTPDLYSMPACNSPELTVVPMTASSLVNNCDETMTTLSTGTVVITFSTTSTPQQYSPACVQISVGGMVTFQGDFTQYALSPGPGAVENNPITFTNMGTTATFTFPTAGAYPFYSTADPTTMLGAVFVTP